MRLVIAQRAQCHAAPAGRDQLDLDLGSSAEQLRMPDAAYDLMRVATCQPPCIMNRFGPGLRSATKTETNRKAKPQTNKFRTRSNQHQRNGADRNVAPYPWH